VRLGEQLIYKLACRYGEHALAYRQLAARTAGLPTGTSAPRLLVRVDEFPHAQAWDEPERFGTSRFERFHEIMAGTGVPYLIAVLPRVSRAPLSPAGTDSRPLQDAEVAVLRRLAGERVSFALHGRDHRTRFASPRHHSELCGLDRAQTERLIDEALAELAAHGIRPDVFVPPFNRFDARQLEWLADRFAVVCGGPESIGLMGFQRTPQRRGDVVYLPSYAPYYGRAAEPLKALPRAIERARGRWVPIVLHWGWEAEAGWTDLARLAELIAPYAAPWDDFLATVERNRSTPSPVKASRVE
jgi:Uncharacterized protein conserved in bacteria (DUF2334)